jgi:hypothetical protein
MKFGPAVHIPSNEGPELELEDVLLAVIDPKLGGHLMKVLGQEAPLRHLQHLKRIRKQEGSNNL